MDEDTPDIFLHNHTYPNNAPKCTAMCEHMTSNRWCKKHASFIYLQYCSGFKSRLTESEQK